MKKKAKSTYEKFIENEEQKELLDKEYKELLISELLIATKHGTEKRLKLAKRIV